jgi:membrane protein DedA with SNARE-associated domain
MHSLFAWLSEWGPFGLFGLLVFGIVGLPIPDETLLVFSGYLTAEGQMRTVPTFLAAYGGALCGISISYLLGRTAGHAIVLRYGGWFHLTPARLQQVHRWFQRTGNWLLTIGYFIPGVRHFTALVAGMSELEYLTFAAYAYPGGIFWATVFLVLGRIVGRNWEAAVALVHRYTVAVALGAAVLVLLVWWLRRRFWNRRSAPGPPR